MTLLLFLQTPSSANPTPAKNKYIGLIYQKFRPNTDIQGSPVALTSVITGVAGKTSTDVPRGYTRSIPDYYAQANNYVLTSPAPPCGVQKTELFGYNFPKVNAAKVALESQSNINLPPQSFVSVIGTQSTELPPRGLSSRSWLELNNITQFQGYVLTSAAQPNGDQYYDVPPYRPASKAYLEITFQPVAEEQLETLTIGTQFTDLPPIGYKHFVKDWIQQTSQTFVTVIGGQFYDLPPKTYIPVVRDYIVQFQNFVLTSQNPKVASFYDNTPRGYARPVSDFVASIPQTIFNQLNTSVAHSDYTVFYPIARSYLHTSYQPIYTLQIGTIDTIGAQVYDLPPIGYTHFTKDQAISVPNFVLTSADLPNGKSQTDLAPWRYASRVYLEITFQPVYEEQLETLPVGVQSYVLPEFNTSARNQNKISLEAQSNINVPPQTFVTVAGQQSYDLPPRGYTPIVRDFIDYAKDYQFNEPQVQSAYDLPPRGLSSRAYLEIVQQPVTEEQLETLAVGVQSFELPPRTYTPLVRDFYVQVPNFVLVSAAQPIGKISTYLPPYRPSSRAYLEIIQQPVYEIQLEVLTSGVQVYELPPRGYKRPVQDWTFVQFIATVPQVIPYGVQETELLGYDTIRIAKYNIAIRSQLDQNIPQQELLGITPYDDRLRHFSGVIGFNTAIIANIVPGSPPTRPSPGIETYPDVVGYVELRRKWHYIALTAITHSQQIELPLPDGKQETELLGYDKLKVDKYREAVRSQDEVLQVPQYLLTSPGQPEGKQLTTADLQNLWVVRNAETRAAIDSQASINIPPQSFVSVAGAQFYDLPPKGYKHFTKDWINVPSQNQLNSAPPPTGKSTYALPILDRHSDRRQAVETQSNVSIPPQSFVSVAGRQIYDLPTRARRVSQVDFYMATPNYRINEPIVSQSYDLPPRGYNHVVSDWIYASPQSSVDPIGVTLIDGTQRISITRAYITDIASVPYYILNEPIVHQTFDNPSRGYKRVVADWTYSIPQKFVSPIGLSVFDNPRTRVVTRTYLEPQYSTIINQPCVTQTTELPPRGCGAINTGWIYSSPQAAVSIVGNIISELPVRRLSRVYLESQIATPYYVITVPKVASIYDSVPVSYISRSYLEIEQQTVLQSYFGTMPPGRQLQSFDRSRDKTVAQTDISPVLGFILNEPKIGSHTELPQSGYPRIVIDWSYSIPQKFVSVVGSSALDIPRIRPVSRTYLESISHGFIFNQPATQRTYDLASRRLTSRAYLDQTFQPAIQPRFDPTGSSIFETILTRVVRRTYLEQQFFTSPYRLNEPLNVQSYALPPRGYPRVVEAWAYSIPQSFVSVAGQHSYELPPRGYRRHLQDHVISIPETIRSQVNTNATHSEYTVVYTTKSRSYLDVGIQLANKLVSLTRTVGTQSYDLPVRSINRQHAIFTESQTLQSFVTVPGKQISTDLLVTRKISAQQTEQTTAQEYIGKKPFIQSWEELFFNFGARIRKINSAIDSQWIQSHIVTQTTVTTTGTQVYTNPIIGLKSRIYLEIVTQPILTLQVETLPTGTQQVVTPVLRKKIQQPEQVASFCCESNVPFVPRLSEPIGMRGNSRVYLEFPPQGIIRELPPTNQVLPQYRFSIATNISYTDFIGYNVNIHNVMPYGVQVYDLAPRGYKTLVLDWVYSSVTIDSSVPVGYTLTSFEYRTFIKRQSDHYQVPICIILRDLIPPLHAPVNPSGRTRVTTSSSATSVVFTREENNMVTVVNDGVTSVTVDDVQTAITMVRNGETTVVMVDNGETTVEIVSSGITTIEII